MENVLKKSDFFSQSEKNAFFSQKILKKDRKKNQKHI